MIPLVAATGDVVAVGVTFTDTTRYRVLQDAVEASRNELETAYEELQSTVEELETTNEELQSTNEELETNLRTDELHSANAFLEAVLASINVGVVVVDPDLRVTAWNRESQDLWGLRAEEVEGEHLMNLDIGLPVEQLRKGIRAAQSGDVVEVLLDAVNRRGRAIRCKVTANPMADSNGGSRGTILVMEPADAE